MFDDASVKQAITSALQTDISIPDNKRVALVTFINTDKAQIAMATRINNNWKVELIAEHDWIGDNKAGAIIKGEW